ncbi:cell wall hydrolase [Burkholderia pseudomallei]|uniref:cell wall hydrolase n=1 Tax=Burkholderia pseudomallei TaxID=28450 RepID=UPI0024E01DA6|nr:cell wall hydrolase [Burkholderia pseudomallei]
MSILKKLLLCCVLSLALVHPALAQEKAKKERVYHVCSPKDGARDLLACNMYREARGEGERGMMAVGFVTINRRGHDSFPPSIKGVVYQKAQFSWTLTKKSFKVHDIEAWELARETAKFLLDLNKFPWAYEMLDFTFGSIYYHTIGVKPIWRHALKYTATIGNHRFYKEK